MNTRRLLVMVVVIGMLAIGVTALAAQGGNGAGPGPVTGDCPLGDACPMAQNQAQMGNGFGPGSANAAANGAFAQQQMQNQAQMGNGFGPSGRWGNAAGTTSAAGRFAAATAPLTDEAVEAMTAGWLDEANAYAAYEALIAQFGEVIPFVQLQRAEAQHMSAWERQFERFGLTLPEMPVAEPLPDFASLTEACAAGAALEEANIGLYDQMFATFESYPSLTRVATALRSASLEHHLPALEACAG